MSPACRLYGTYKLWLKIWKGHFKICYKTVDHALKTPCVVMRSDAWIADG